ncbi:hypothetical protein ABPG74_001962 [Tetrahymena malaccensis]
MEGCEICQKNQIGLQTCSKCLNTFKYFEQTNTCIKTQCEQDQFLIMNSSNQEQCVSVCPNGFVKNYGNLTCQIGELCSLEYFQNSQLSNDRMAINAFFGVDELILVFYGNLINVFNAENGSFVRQMQFESDIILIKYVNQNIYLLSDQNKVFIWDQVYQQSLLCSIIQNGVISASSDILLVKISFENQALILNSYIISFNNSYSFVISYLIENNQGQISLLQFNSQYTCFVNSNRIIYIEQIMINSEIALILLFENQQSIFIVKKDSNICEEISTSQQILLKSQFLQSCETSATDCQQRYFIFALSQNNTIILIDLLQQNMISQWQFQQQIQDFAIIQSQKQDQILVLTNKQIQAYQVNYQNLTQLTLFNQQQIYIDSPVKLVYLTDNKGKNYLGVLSDQIQILDLSLNKSLFSSQFSEFEYYNSDQITQIAISDDKLFLASCDISGKVVVCLKIAVYTEQQIEIAAYIFDNDLYDAQISSYDEIFVIDSTNAIQKYQFNEQLMQMSKTGYAYNLIFSFDKMFLFNYPNQNVMIIVNDKNNQISILDSNLDQQNQKFGFSYWIDTFQIGSNKIFQNLMARFSKILTFSLLQKKINQYNQTHYYVFGVFPQSISQSSIGEWFSETNTGKYSHQKQLQGGLVVKAVLDKQQTFSCAGTINGYFQCVPINELDPTKNIFQLQQNQLNNDEILFIKMTFYHGVYYIIQKTKIQVFDLFTNQLIKLIQFEIEQEIPKAGEIILDFQVYENLGIFLSYNSKQIILQDIANDKLYSIVNIQLNDSIEVIQGCILDETLQKIFFYGKTIMQANLDLSDLQIKSPQSHYNFEICLFLENVVICKLLDKYISIYDKFNEFKIIKLIQIQLQSFHILVDEQNRKIFSYQNGALVHDFDGTLLTLFDTQNEKIFQFDICSSYLIAYTPSSAYVISRQLLQIVQKIILSGQQFVKGFCFSSINLIAYSTNSLATSQFILFSLTTLQQKGAFKSSYINNGLGNTVNIMYDKDYNLLFFLDTLGNCQFIEFDLLFYVKNQLVNEEISKQVNDPPKGSLIDLNMNEVFIYNKMNVWRFSYNYLTQNYYRAYENEFQYYILVSSQSDIQVNSLLISDKNQNLFLYDQQQMTFIQSFQDNIIDMKKLKQSNQNIYIFAFQSYLKIVKENSINILNNFKTSYSLNSVQFRKFLLVDENIAIFQTQDNQLIDYDFINNEMLYRNQFNQNALIISSFNLKYATSNLQEQNILLLSLSTGEMIRYNILIKQSQIIQPYEDNNVIQQFIKKDNSTLVLIMKLGNIIQVDINTMKQQNTQIYNQNAQSINQSANLNKASNTLLFEFDNFYQRYFISISYEKKLGVFNLQTDQFIKFLSFPDQFMKKIYFYGQHLVLGCSFQLNFYNATDLQFIQRFRKSNYQFQIQQFLQVDNNTYAISYQIAIEIILIDIQNQIKSVHFKELTFSNIVSINYIKIDNNYQILAITQKGVYDLRLSQQQILSQFSSSGSNQNANQQCYLNFPFQNSFFTENKLDNLFNANSQSNMNFTLNVGVNTELLFGNILSSNQNQTDVIFNPNSLNSSLLLLNQNSFNFINIDVNLINFYLAFQDMEQQQVQFSKNTQNINFQSIKLSNQNISYGNQIQFESKKTVKLVDFEIKNVNFTYTQRLLQQTHSDQFNPKGLLYFKDVQYLLIDQMNIENISILTDKFTLIQADTIQTVIIKSLKISNSFLIGNFLYLNNIENLKIETFQIENCSSTQTKSIGVINQFYLLQLLGIQQALINNFISTQNSQIQLLRSVNYFQTDNFIRNLNDDSLTIQNILVNQTTFLFQQQDQINIFYLQNNNINLKNILFIQNEGNILIIQSQKVFIDSSYFYKNQGIDGACLSLQSLQSVSINNTQFIENSALASGGSIFCQDISSFATNQFTTFKNNSAQIGGAIRLIISNSQNLIYLNQQNSIQAQFEGNIGQIYGNNIGKYPETFQLFDSKQNILFEGNLFDQDPVHRMFSVKDVGSGDNFYLQIRLYDDKGKVLKIDQNKISNNTYHPSITNELGQYIFEIQDPTNFVEVRQQSIITYLQYNSTTLSFNFDNIVLAAFPNRITNTTNLELKVTPWQTRQTLNFLISFRNCKVGEAFLQISSLIIQCQECSEGMYTVAEPILNLQDLSQNQCKKCPIGVDSCHSNILIVSKGFWRENQQSDIIVKCNNNNPNICDSQNIQSIQGCIEGYIGPLCETCDTFGKIWKNGFYANTIKDSNCQKCDNPPLNLLYFVIIMFFLIWFLICYIHLFMNTCVIESQGYYLRMLDIVPINQTSYKDSFFIIKIMLNYMQIAYLLYSSDSLLPEFLSYLIQYFIKPIQKINLSIQCLYHLLNMSYRQNQKLSLIKLTSLSYIVTPLIILSVVAFLLNVIKKYKRIPLIKIGFNQIIIQIVFLFLQFDVLSYYVSTFACRMIGDKNYLTISLELQCEDSDFLSFRLVQYEINKYKDYLDNLNSSKKRQSICTSSKMKQFQEDTKMFIQQQVNQQSPKNLKIKDSMQSSQQKLLKYSQFSSNIITSQQNFQSKKRRLFRNSQFNQINKNDDQTLKK